VGVGAGVEVAFFDEGEAIVDVADVGPAGILVGNMLYNWIYVIYKKGDSP